MVLKTADRKVMQVRVLSPAAIASFNNLPAVHGIKLNLSICHLADFGAI